MAVVIDIETAGESWDKIDVSTQKILRDRVTRLNADVSEENAEELAISDLGVNPYTGEIIALGMYDTDNEKGAVYFQAPNSKITDWEDGEIKYKKLSEKQILEKFWELSEKYKKFVTFSGRSFDIPFILIRSAINEIKPNKDLMRNRYLSLQHANAQHIDLYDQLSFYGSIPRLGGLHLACRAFGIETPKDGEIEGKEVGNAFKDGKYKEIAEYNARDIIATAKLYKYWNTFLNFQG
ncbi:ribonuclease H-like domain-containing protein [Candidatus Berkelbacteria bacterium]|nr:ribonuclease H-like domain-containing protein [Candidatus Berkelbacteria bacterium]